MIDLRSDTITNPTDKMREVMAKASVGDDVLGEDHTVNELESLTAEVLGTEAAVYMPSGTMTNQVAIRTHTEPGDEIFGHEHSHVFLYEAGAPAALSGVMCNLLKGERGIFSEETLLNAIRKKDIHLPRPRLLCVENTHNRGGGSIWPVETLASVSQAARGKGLKVHLDGARLWNAAAAMGLPEKQLVSTYFDSVSVCFSKGLGAPVGSALAGKADFIERARRFRKMFGGAMRQAGIIAAGALYALRNNRSRLKDDHANAKLLAEGLADIEQIDINEDHVQTNIVIFRITSMTAEEFVGQLSRNNVLMQVLSEDTVRAVTSLMVTDGDIRQAIGIIRKIL